VSLGCNGQLDELAGCELFSGRFVSELQFSHELFLLLSDDRDPPRPASPRLRSLPVLAAPRLSAMAELVQVTDTVHLAQGDAVNWVLVTDDSGVMLIDAGYPGDRLAMTRATCAPSC
jgi:hypothetical protein